MMMESKRTSKGLSPRQRRLLFRAWHRGIKEMDLLYGRFVDTYMDRLSDAEMEALERLFEESDQLVLAWITGAVPVPGEHATPLFEALRAFAQTMTRPDEPWTIDEDR